MSSMKALRCTKNLNQESGIRNHISKFMEGVTQKKLAKSQMFFEVTLTPEVFADAEKKALKAITEHVEIKGFRKGKAPEDMVRRHVGDAKILEEASYQAIDTAYADIVKEYAIHAVGQPKIEVKKAAPGNPFVCTITVAVYPEVKLPDYAAIAQKFSKDLEVPAVKDAEMKEALEWLRKSRRKEVLVTRPAEKGDFVEVDFEARQAGVKIEGGESRNHPLVIGESKFIPGFDAQCEGMQAGEEKKFSLQVPKDYGHEAFRGRSLDFTVKMNAVYAVQLPEINDEFAKSLGSFADVAALEKNISEGLHHEKEREQKEKFRNNVVEAIAKKADMEIADILVDQEVHKMIADIEHNVKDGGLDFETYLTHIKKTRAEVEKDLRVQAETRVRVSLVLAEIAKKENISASEEEVDVRVRDLLRQQEAYSGVDIELLNNYVSGIIRNEKVFALLESGNRK